jgi:hypothetical protein
LEGTLTVTRETSAQDLLLAGIGKFKLADPPETLVLQAIELRHGIKRKTFSPDESPFDYMMEFFTVEDEERERKKKKGKEMMKRTKKGD